MQFKFIAILSILIAGFVQAQMANTSNTSHSLTVLPPPVLHQQDLPAPNLTAASNSTAVQSSISTSNSTAVPSSISTSNTTKSQTPINPPPSNSTSQQQSQPQDIIGAIVSFFSKILGI